jgi:hypothetical protein
MMVWKRENREKTGIEWDQRIGNQEPLRCMSEYLQTATDLKEG